LPWASGVPRDRKRTAPLKFPEVKKSFQRSYFSFSGIAAAVKAGDRVPLDRIALVPEREKFE